MIGYWLQNCKVKAKMMTIGPKIAISKSGRKENGRLKQKRRAISAKIVMSIRENDALLAQKSQVLHENGQLLA